VGDRLAVCKTDTGGYVYDLHGNFTEIKSQHGFQAAAQLPDGRLLFLGTRGDIDYTVDLLVYDNVHDESAQVVALTELVDGKVPFPKEIILHNGRVLLIAEVHHTDKKDTIAVFEFVEDAGAGRIEMLGTFSGETATDVRSFGNVVLVADLYQGLHVLRLNGATPSARS
jgi:hypothetical protein